MNKNDTKKCFNSHMGDWLAEPKWLNRAITAVKSGMYAESDVGNFQDTQPLQVIEGIAIIQITGMMTKGFSKFGGTSTVETRMQVREATNNPDVSHILLLVDSAGGQVAGTKELADEVARAKQVKPVIAQIEDLGASASLWVASQATKVYANHTAEVGSIGVVSVLHDTSEAYEREGVKVIVVSTGDMKGAFTDGTPITDSMVSSLQSKVDALNKFFLTAIAEGRGLSMSQVTEMATGDTFIASKALELGLIDGIQTTDETMRQLSQEILNSSIGQRTSEARAKFYKVQSQSRIDTLRSNL